ncbi:hypothetical protein BDM02DRAFT_3109411 [Thelephora ganbajun]|uniref:Uncharacterized protein n=1 Tax=Thelephora ganbajun TaxID=370292 RepID=A0ACB6ZS07_THEGA|nr:hypothetical protein BDM02DRAFT_3109411 [Thelephora ganbajun]
MFYFVFLRGRHQINIRSLGGSVKLFLLVILQPVGIVFLLESYPETLATGSSLA